MSVTGTGGITLADLRRVMGADGAREATVADTVDGVQPRFVATPASVAEASALLAWASSAGLAVAPRGGGTKLGWGNPPTRLDLVVSTARLDRILEHAAGDLVVRAEAGVTLERLQEALAGAGQMLALDPPEGGATLGGIIAANASGPRRLRYGTVRDLIIGITVVLADGTVARAGGKVVKNVAGYDLGKLFTGSLGTLGLIVEAIFRLHPLPAARRTVVAEVESPDAAGAAVQTILHSTLVPTALELAWGTLPGGGTLAVLFEGIAPGVVAQAEAARELLAPHGPARILDAGSDGAPQHAAGRPRRDEQVPWPWPSAYPWSQGASVGVKVNHVPADLPRLWRDVLSGASAHGLSGPSALRIAGHAASGITLVGLPDGDEGEIVAAIEALRESAVRGGGSLVVLQAPPGVKRAIDVWGPAPGSGQGGDALPLMRRIKEHFDPLGTLNPGRFVGGI